MLEGGKKVCEWSWRPKIVNFCCTEAGLTSKGGRISPAVYWCHWIQSTDIVERYVMSRGVAGKLAD